MEVIPIQNFVALGGVPIITALVQVTKAWIHEHRYYPVLAILFGLIINIGVFWAIDSLARADIVTACFNGIISGLASSGLYSGVSSNIKTDVLHRLIGDQKDRN